MVEKLSINNELILMKKTIAQAKVCVISKLVKKLREAKEQLDKAVAPIPLRLSTRPAKLTEQIEYLKHNGNVELATKCLISQLPAQKVLTNPQSSNADVALAQLQSYKTVAGKVAAIKLKYDLDATEVDWRTAIGEVGKKKQKKTVKEAHLKRKAEIKERKDKESAAVKNRAEWLEENLDGAENEVDGGSDAEADSGDDSGDGAPDVESDAGDDETDGDSDSESKSKKKLKAKSKPATKTPKEPKTKTKPIEPPAKKLKPTIESKQSKPIAVKSIETIAPPPVQPPKRKLDSFFVTSGGSAYMSTGFEERHQPLGPMDGMDRRQRRAQQFGKVAPRAKRPMANGNDKRPAQQHQQHARHVAPSSKFPNKTMGGVVRPSHPAEVAADLHPSWAAKQKTKGIANFQGSKKTFGDDDNGDDADKKPAASQRNGSGGGGRSAGAAAASTTTTDAAAVDAAKMHPSWLAKQKLKPVISEFQGKKITFGD